MVLVSIIAASLAGALGGAIAYAFGYGVIGILVAYSAAGQVTFVAIVSLIIRDPDQEELDFQQQVELDLLALQEEMLRENETGKRVNVFHQDQTQHRARDNRIPRPLNPSA